MKRQISSSKDAMPKLREQKDGGVLKTTRRVFEIFEYLAGKQGSASVSEIVQALDYPQSSTSMLLKALARLRYLEYDRYSRRYIPTMRIALLGSWIHDQLFSETSLARLVEELHESSKAAVIIVAMQNDIHAQYIHLLQRRPNDLNWNVRPGSLRPLCLSAVGRILLSLKLDIEVVHLIRRINAEELDRSHWIRESELLRILDNIRMQGYAYTEGTVTPGTGVIAVQLPSSPNQPHMAIGLGGPLMELREHRNEYLDLLQKRLLPYTRKHQK